MTYFISASTHARDSAGSIPADSRQSLAVGVERAFCVEEGGNWGGGPRPRSPDIISRSSCPVVPTNHAYVTLPSLAAFYLCCCPVLSIVLDPHAVYEIDTSLP